jgi:hypothetical protein
MMLDCTCHRRVRENTQAMNTYTSVGKHTCAMCVKSKQKRTAWPRHTHGTHVHMAHIHTHLYTQTCTHAHMHTPTHTYQAIINHALYAITTQHGSVDFGIHYLFEQPWHISYEYELRRSKLFVSMKHDVLIFSLI